ncbi:K(+) transport system NAD-binding component fused to Ion channel [Methanonatronarchaeum thermophilum]|uniref:K(+) transport system NAD-binding component fused to Ion channel n=1 Tax=Methanonatronarchaeum thermophilum TaxID=1927129 RepID=A0A1Y3GAK7_9EURY|nr:NAD-binding protein [Methanonatronarchaeum thermophilum]OUJ18491.1 K(+) transport system NAD-binding component fused to Ion channel [Methanonatronarchaeum thermophilum]
MKWWAKRIGLSIIGFIAIVASFTLIYQWGMFYFEGQERNIYQSLQKVIEILTTAGFGGDAEHWTTLGMNLIVVSMNLTAVLLIFIGLPLVVIPMFKRALEGKVARSSDLTDHVIICSHSPADEILTQELKNSDIPYLFIERNLETVEKLLDMGHEAIVGDPEKVETLKAANADKARALVADVGDSTNPTIILSAKKVNPRIRVISMTRLEKEERYHMLAGADYVVKSRKVLGESLANRALSSVAEKFNESIELKTKLKPAELLVEEESPIIGKKLREIEQFNTRKTTVIGIWTGGKFIASPEPDTEIKENAIILVLTETLYFENLEVRPISSYHGKLNKVIVCGYGTVGPSTVKTLKKAGLDVQTIDLNPGENIDIVGDVTNLDTIKKADLKNARSVILTLNDDTAAVYATLIIKHEAPEVEIIARANSPETIWKLYNAGADFVLSLPTVAGEILASVIIKDRTILTPKTKLEFARIPIKKHSGKTMAELDIRNKTGATIIAVERENKLLTKINAEFAIKNGDTMIAVGNKRNIKKIKQLFK